MNMRSVIAWNLDCCFFIIVNTFCVASVAKIIEIVDWYAIT